EIGASMKIVTSERVIYGDTDQMGVVYYANYLRWFEKGRSEFLRQMGLPYKTIEEQGLHFPVTEVSCRYFKSAHYDDMITMARRPPSLSPSTSTDHSSNPLDRDALSLAYVSTRHACIHTDGRITRIPTALAAQLARALVTSFN